MDELNSLQAPDIFQVLREMYKRITTLESDILRLKNTTSPVLVSTTTGINAKTTGTTTLFTVPSNKNFIVTDVVVRVTGFTAGSKSIQAVANLGGNSTAFDNYVSAKTFTVSANGQYRRISLPDTLLQIYASGTNFSIKITTGSNATTETWTVDIYGYYI